MIIDFNEASLQEHIQVVVANKLRATAIISAVRKTPALVAAMYTSKPSWIHELPLEQVAQVAEELCEAGYANVVTDMSENRSVLRDYRQVLDAVVSGDSVIL